MNAEPDDHPDDNKTPTPIKIGYILTGVWTLVVGWLFTNAAACPSLNQLAGIVVRQITCRPINEIGDFLAGAFAPVAFLWLFVAVLVQAEELKAQRKELRLTRKEFKGSRGVAEATQKAIEQQAKTAGESAFFIGTQTEYLKEQLAHQRQLRHEQNLSQLLDQLKSLLLGRVADKTIFWRNSGGFEPFFSKAHMRAQDRDQAIIEMALAVSDRVERWRSELEANQAKVAEQAEEIVSLLDSLVGEILSSMDELSGSDSIRIDAFSLRELKAATNYLLARLAAQGG